MMKIVIGVVIVIAGFCTWCLCHNAGEDDKVNRRK